MARFERATFGEDASFKWATFKGIVTFTDEQKEEICELEEKYRFYGKLNFSSISFRTINIDLPSECFKHPKAEAELAEFREYAMREKGIEIMQTGCLLEKEEL